MWKLPAGRKLPQRRLPAERKLHRKQKTPSYQLLQRLRPMLPWFVQLHLPPTKTPIKILISQGQHHWYLTLGAWQGKIVFNGTLLVQLLTPSAIELAAAVAASCAEVTASVAPPRASFNPAEASAGSDSPGLAPESPLLKKLSKFAP